MADQAAHNRFGEMRTPGSAEGERRTINEAGEQGSNRQAAGFPEEERMRRAEEWVDRIGARVGEATALLGHQLLRLGARVREQAEDIWAEAQNLRRGQRP
jgi:hypothetical protein